MIPNATASEPAGTARLSHHGCSRRRSILTRASSHEVPELLDVRGRTVELAYDLALVHHENPVGERPNLVEVLAQEQDRHSLRGGLTQIRVHGLDRPDVETAC